MTATPLEADLAEVFARHRRRLRRDGVGVPAWLATAETLCVFVVRGRQDTTSVDGASELVDAAAMPLLLDLDEVAHQLGVSRRQAERLAKAGELPTVQIGERNRRVRTADLAAYVEALEVRGVSAGRP